MSEKWRFQDWNETLNNEITSMREADETYQQKKAEIKPRNLGVIYKIVNPKGRVYIGRTMDLVQRFSYYRSAHCHNQTVLYNSLIKYGGNGHKATILSIAFEDELPSLEVFWIKEYSSNYRRYPEINGMNLTDGGEGFTSTHTAETKLKMSLRKKGISNPHARVAVHQYTKGGEYLRSWDSIAEAASYHNVTAGAITYAQLYNALSCGFLWSTSLRLFIDNYNKTGCANKVCAYDSNWNFVAEYKSVREAAASTAGEEKAYRNKIERAIEKNKMCYGYYWKFGSPNK